MLTTFFLNITGYFNSLSTKKFVRSGAPAILLRVYVPDRPYLEQSTKLNQRSQICDYCQSSNQKIRQNPAHVICHDYTFFYMHFSSTQYLPTVIGCLPRKVTDICTSFCSLTSYHGRNTYIHT